MHIKKLEISGFKSFCDRTIIHFDHDVIGVVGPNGCGKSNIVDAIRWCMGEQSARQLRGRAMEDVIFNGSESRGPHGMAEVTITFDNSDPRSAAELAEEYRAYPEIAVTRRLYRDGTSEYLLNKTAVRLRDVTELFLGTGVGARCYSIVEQGRIGQIVSARPEDRRVIIEEAAGVTKYKQRRKQAERKMELTRQNLSRLSDIVGEIERTRASLKRQVAKAERFLAYRSELDDLVLHEASNKWLELTVLSRVESEQLDQASEQVDQLRARLDQAEAELESAREEASVIEQKTDAASQSAFEADNQVSTLHAQMARAQDRLSHLSERLATIDAERTRVSARVSELAAEKLELEARVETLSADEEVRAADVATEEEALTGLRSEEAVAAEEVQQHRAQAAELGKSAAAAEARLDGVAQRLLEAQARQERLAAEQEALVGERGTLEARQHALEQSLLELAEGKRLTQAERSALESELEILRGRMRESERAVDVAKNELGFKRNRLRALEELHRRHEGIGNGVRALLSLGDPSVLGLVADRVEAPEPLTLAVAGLLGERLQWVVVNDMARGLELLGALQANQRGRAHLVPARPRHVAGACAPLDREREGTLGYLVDQLSYAPEDEALVRSLVGNAVVAASAADAYRIVHEVPGVSAAVALDGTVVRADGTVSGGSGDDVASAMVEQRREMRQLAEQVEQLSARSHQLLEEHNALRAREAECSAALERARHDAHQGELAHVGTEKDLAKTAADLERVVNRAAALQAELGDLSTAIEAAERDETTFSRELDLTRVELEQIQHGLERSEALAASWRDQVAAQAALLTERKVRLAQVGEQAGAARSALDRVVQSAQDLTSRADRLESDVHESVVGYGETAARLMLAREENIEAQLVAREAHSRLNDARALLDQVRHALGASESELKQLRDVLTTADDQARRSEMALQRLTLERDHLLSVIRDRFRGLELTRVIGDYHTRPAPDAEQHRRIEELSQLIDRMGPVNLEARTEFEDADRRFTELSAQKVDVEQALAELERAIKHMNRESRRKFKETFDAVNELFKKTFRRLFNGGRAELVLTDPEDLLGTGVEIVAQPPGKKLGNIELMSGGEKALTAVALILAIFQHKPAPFCVLDEVDAPLDEANVARYTEAIRTMTEHSQFVLITHVRRTMQAVDVLYGVTMGEPGVSRLVSVKVNENATTRSDSRAANVLRSTAPPQLDAESETQVA
jgi:chromosome segregation protein